MLFVHHCYLGKVWNYIHLLLEFSLIKRKTVIQLIDVPYTRNMKHTKFIFVPQLHHASKIIHKSHSWQHSVKHKHSDFNKYVVCHIRHCSSLILIWNCCVDSWRPQVQQYTQLYNTSLYWQTGDYHPKYLHKTIIFSNQHLFTQNSPESLIVRLTLTAHMCCSLWPNNLELET